MRSPTSPCRRCRRPRRRSSAARPRARAVVRRRPRVAGARARLHLVAHDDALREPADGAVAGARARRASSRRRSIARSPTASAAATRWCASITAPCLRLFGVSSLSTVMLGSDGWFYWLGEDGHSLDRHYRGTLPFPQSEVDGTVAELVRRQRMARGARHRVRRRRGAREVHDLSRAPARRGSRARRCRRRTIACAPRWRADGRVTFVDLRAPLARRQGARARLLPDRLALELQRRDRRLRRDHARGAEGACRRCCPRSRPSSGPPTRPASTTTAATSCRCSACRRAWARTTWRRSARSSADVASRCARRIDKDEFPGFEFYVCDRPGLPRAVVLRDSMAISLIPLLSENFSRVVYVSTRALDRALIEREKPDIVIEELVERSLHAPGGAADGQCSGALIRRSRPCAAPARGRAPGSCASACCGPIRATRPLPCDGRRCARARAG